MKKTILSTLGAAALLCFCQGQAQAQMLNISEVYGGGGNTNATYTNDFIELYNYGNTAFTLTGYSVFYAPATGAAFTGSTALTGSIAPGQYYLVSEASGGAVGAALPTANASGNINLAAGAGKVAIALSTTALTAITPGGAGVLDYVGYGTTANAFTGTGPAPGGSNTTSTNKVDVTVADTNNASPAFAAGAPTPVPEPSTYATLALGVLGVFAMLRARRRTA